MKRNMTLPTHFFALAADYNDPGHDYVLSVTTVHDRAKFEADWEETVTEVSADPEYSLNDIVDAMVTRVGYVIEILSTSCTVRY